MLEESELDLVELAQMLAIKKAVLQRYTTMEEFTESYLTNLREAITEVNSDLGLSDELCLDKNKMFKRVDKIEAKADDALAVQIIKNMLSAENTIAIHTLGLSVSEVIKPIYNKAGIVGKHSILVILSLNHEAMQEAAFEF